MALTKRILERAGYFVRCADSLAVARALLIEFTPDGVILEKELPDGNGLEYCRELRKISSLPVMLFSGDKADELPALQAGASDYIKIPCDYDVMKARINIMLGSNDQKLTRLVR